VPVEFLLQLYKEGFGSSVVTYANPLTIHSADETHVGLRVHCKPTSLLREGAELRPHAGVITGDQELAEQQARVAALP
jgi:hypothetical protein